MMHAPNQGVQGNAFATVWQVLFPTGGAPDLDWQRVQIPALLRQQFLTLVLRRVAAAGINPAGLVTAAYVCLTNPVADPVARMTIRQQAHSTIVGCPVRWTPIQEQALSLVAQCMQDDVHAWRTDAIAEIADATQQIMALAAFAVYQDYACAIAVADAERALQIADLRCLYANATFGMAQHNRAGVPCQ